MSDPQTQGSNATILLVDDEPSNIQLIAGYLKNDYHLKVATSGKQCLLLTSLDPKPDLIILDIDMPEMNGYDVCKKLKENIETSTIPVIFVTAMQAEEDEEKGLLLGAIDYLTKPVRPAILKARIVTHIQLKKQRDALVNMALKDQLTHLYNRYYLLETANQRVAKALRNQTSISILMMDIDHFKIINDTYGHASGDHTLKAFADLLMQECRQEDIVSRFGGEEFLVFLDDCELSTASKIAERIRQRVEHLRPDNINVSVSIGVAELKNKQEIFSELVKRADDAMYEAKKMGRNRVRTVSYN